MMKTGRNRTLTWAAAVATAFTAAAAATAGGGAGADALVRTLRDRAKRISGFTAGMSVKAGGAVQTGTLLYLAPENVHMEMTIPGLGEQRIISDGRLLWTVTPQARVATRVDLAEVRKVWPHPLPNQALAIRDVFEVVEPGSIRFLRNETLKGEKTHVFEAQPRIGAELRRDARIPDRMRVWVGEDGLLRRQILMKGKDELMDASFRITDRNPHIRPGLFTFDPPRDWQVQDLTQSTLDTLKSIAAGRPPAAG